MHLYDVIKIFDRGSNFAFLKFLQKFVSFHGSCPRHEIVIQSGYEMQEFPLEELELKNKLT